MMCSRVNKASVLQQLVKFRSSQFASLKPASYTQIAWEVLVSRTVFGSSVPSHTGGNVGESDKCSLLLKVNTHLQLKVLSASLAETSSIMNAQALWPEYQWLATSTHVKTVEALPIK